MTCTQSEGNSLYDCRVGEFNLSAVILNKDGQFANDNADPEFKGADCICVQEWECAASPVRFQATPPVFPLVTALSTTLADLFKLHVCGDPFSAVRTSRRHSSDGRDDGVTDGRRGPSGSSSLKGSN
jgi:hypothetical protein